MLTVDISCFRARGSTNWILAICHTANKELLAGCSVFYIFDLKLVFQYCVFIYYLLFYLSSVSGYSRDSCGLNFKLLRKDEARC